MAAGDHWTRDELLVAFNLYCRTPFGRLHRSNPDVIRLARLLRRTPNAAAMKLCNFANFDPAQKARKRVGLKNASGADEAMFMEFWNYWHSLAAESEVAAERIGLGAVGPLPEESAEDLAARVGETEVVRGVPVRRVQSLFRATVLSGYNFECAISGIRIPELLEAGHIIPWNTDESRRGDPRNGIALSVLHHRAFDLGLIAFDDDFRVVVSHRLVVKHASVIHRAALVAIEGTQLRKPSRYEPDATALAWHRREVFVA
ncbi:MAG: HNH endonuclease [Phycisphaerales bacterium]|nr:HNH endonuclease [Phycisphaerales bacterium]